LTDLLYGRPATVAAALADAVHPGERWVLGAALGALGRYGESLAVLAELARAQPATRYGSLAYSTAASHYRQLGRHDDARPLDLAALDLAALDLAALNTAADDPDAVFDAQLGLAADAVGSADAGAAREHLALARAVADGWRCAVRLGWVETEIALLTGDPGAAIDAARPALATARAAQAPRHVAKCLLFLGVSERVAEHRDAATTLAEASAAADELQALPLRWVAEAVLAELPGADAERHRAAAATAIRAIADHLDGEDQTRWVERPDIALLLSGGA
jgi:tetratricopeptide (TPR) repeat protein